VSLWRIHLEEKNEGERVKMEHTVMVPFADTEKCCKEGEKSQQERNELHLSTQAGK
jgi:hypothetical protein